MQAVTITQITPPELEILIENSIRKILGSQKHEHHLDSDHLLTIQEASAFLNLTVPTLYGYVHRAEIPVMKKSKRLYFSKQQLMDWVKEGQKKTISEIHEQASDFVNIRKKKSS